MWTEGESVGTLLHMTRESSTTIQIRVKDSFLALIDEQAAADGMNRSQLILLAVQKHLHNVPTLDGATRLAALPAAVASIPTIKPASELPPPITPRVADMKPLAPATKCRQCGSPLQPKGVGMACYDPQCGRSGIIV